MYHRESRFRLLPNVFCFLYAHFSTVAILYGANSIYNSIIENGCNLVRSFFSIRIRIGIDIGIGDDELKLNFHLSQDTFLKPQNTSDTKGSTIDAEARRKLRNHFSF